MLTFMDYIVHAFGSSTDWNHDNSYSALTATSDALVSFPTPSSLTLHVSSLSTPQFATSYSLSTIGFIKGNISYLYSSVPLCHISSRTPSIPLRSFVRGYRDVELPTAPTEASDTGLSVGRKPTLLHATLALPTPSILTGVYARRVNPATLVSILLNSKSTTSAPAGTSSGPPPASVLAHVQYDTGRYSVEGLGSTDNMLLGLRGLWNFGLGPPLKAQIQHGQDATGEAIDGLSDLPIPPSLTSTKPATDHTTALTSKPSLLSAGAEVYYSPLSSVIGLSTGLRFTTLGLSPSSAHGHPSHSKPASTKPLAGTSAALSSLAQSVVTPHQTIPTHSSFPYTLTLTLTPLTGSLASTYSVKPTPDLALSSRFEFNVYSWESEYVLGAEIWRRRRRRPVASENATSDPVAWARRKAEHWLSDAERALRLEQQEREDESVIKLRVDDGWNIRALWTGRVKDLLVSAGVNLAPAESSTLRYQYSTPGGAAVNGGGMEKRWKGSFGVEVAYSS